MNCHRASGFHVVDLLLVLAIVGLIAALGVPSLLTASSFLRVRLAAAEMSSVLVNTRYYAIRHDVNVAVKFRTDSGGRVTYALYRDGNGNGVLNRDITSGDDPEVEAERPLATFGRLARFGFPPGPAPTHPGDPRTRLDRLDDPVRFNQSDLASFSPMGTATPGTIYLTDGVHHLVAVRVQHRTGKVTVVAYDREREVWQ